MRLNREINYTLKKKLAIYDDIDDGYYILRLRRKQSDNRFNMMINSMIISAIKIEDGVIQMFNDHKVMQLPSKYEKDKDGKMVEIPGAVIKWDKWYDGFLSMKSLDRVINNKYKLYNVDLVPRGYDLDCFKRLNKILRRRDFYQKFEFLFDELESDIINILENTKNRTWDML